MGKILSPLIIIQLPKALAWCIIKFYIIKYSQNLYGIYNNSYFVD